MVSIRYIWLLAFAVSPLASSEMSIAKLEQEYRNAIGGHEVIPQLNSFQAVGKLEQQGMTKAVNIFKRRPNLYKARIGEGVNTMTVGYDGKRGWQDAPDGTSTYLGDTMTAHLAMEAIFECPLLNYDEKLKQEITYVGETTDNETQYHQIHVAFKSGQTQDYFFNAETFFIEKVETRISETSPALVAKLSSYKKRDRVWSAYEINTFVGDTHVSRVTLNNIDYNIGLISDLFNKPSNH